MVQEAFRLQLAWLRGPCRLGQLWVRPGAAEEALLASPLCRAVRDEERRAAEEALMLVDSAKGAGRFDALRARAEADGRKAHQQLRAMRAESAQLQVRTGRGWVGRIHLVIALVAISMWEASWPRLAHPAFQEMVMKTRGAKQRRVAA